MIGIIGAMAIEVEEILAKLEHPQTETISGMDFVRGTIRGVDCVVARCNVGKVNAAICAQTMILHLSLIHIWHGWQIHLHQSVVIGELDIRFIRIVEG